MSVQFSDMALRHLDEIGYHWDAKLPGFGIRIGKRAKTFICVREGVRTSIGRFPHITLSEARKQALQHLYDPKPTQTSFSVSEAVQRYQDALKVRPNTRRFYGQFLKKLDLAYGKTSLHELTPRQCAEIIKSPHQHLAYKVFFNWLKGQALITISPMDNLKPPHKFKLRQRTLSDAELKAVWQASDNLGTYGIVIKLLCLTAQRRQEIAQVKESWIQPSSSNSLTNLNNTATPLLVIPADVAKNGKEHSVPLSNNAQSMALEFATSLKTPWKNWNRPKERIDKLSGVTNWTLHDLRRTTATNLSRLGTDPFLVERILNHSLPHLQQIYNRHDFTEAMREPLQKHEDWLLKMVQS